MKVLVLGADGYLGWPTCMNLSRLGYDVIGVDNYLRRTLCLQEDCDPLFAVPNLQQRAELWKQKTGKNIGIEIGDLCDWGFVERIFDHHQPDAVVHYAEQPSAPYSQKDYDTAYLTLHNNLAVTFNVIQAVHAHAPSCHIVKLGTMGEYGTPNIDIEEGWIEIEHKGRQDRFLFPRQASSLYHTTKVMDTDLLWFYVRTWGLRVTDLMQGPVYGLETEENAGDERLYPFFNYDELFGTALNRFMVQAVAGYPLTVYGKGGQTRGYIHLMDTLQCVELSLRHPPKEGEMRIFNQFTETFSVNDLAQMVKKTGNELGLDVKIQHLENPRKEMENHYYNPAHTGLVELGLKPHKLTEQMLTDMMRTIIRYKDGIERQRIFRNVKW